MPDRGTPFPGLKCQYKFTTAFKAMSGLEGRHDPCLGKGPPRPKLCPPLPRGRSAFGLASLTFKVRPPSPEPFAHYRHFSFTEFGISTKANPRARPVSRSAMMFTFSTAAYIADIFRNSGRWYREASYPHPRFFIGLFHQFWRFYKVFQVVPSARSLGIASRVWTGSHGLGSRIHLRANDGDPAASFQNSPSLG